VKARLLSFVLLLMMLLVSGLTAAIQPRILLADELGKLDLDAIVPKQFGDWVLDPGPAMVINPQVKETLDKIYNQTLSRTYVNSKGYRVMLSIAYGLDQRDAMQVHYPEVCYPAQGFHVSSNETGVLKTSLGSIPVRHLSTSLSGQRFEPVTYWTTIGEEVVANNSNKKLAELHYGLRGHIPDGLLFRVSSIDRNTAVAFSEQEAFVAQLLPSVEAKHLSRLSGLGSRQDLPNRAFSWLQR